MDGDDRERIRRPRLERTKPIRSVDGLFAAGASPPDGVRAGQRVDDVVGRSVELGYRVVDAYLRRGQEAARRLSAGDQQPNGLVADARDLATRMVRSAAELAAAWGDMFDLTARQGSAGGVEEAPAVPNGF